MILCTSSAHTCAHGQYSIGDRRHDIRCATVGPYSIRTAAVAAAATQSHDSPLCADSFTRTDHASSLYYICILFLQYVYIYNIVY